MSVDRKGKAPASNAAHHLSAGALSGFTSAIILQPLDLLKTRLQQDSHEVVGFKRYFIVKYIATWLMIRRKISTTLKEVVRDDGIQGLWRGTIPTLVRYVFTPFSYISSSSTAIGSKLTRSNVPGVAIYFYALSAIRTELSYLSQFQTISKLSSTSSASTANPNGSALVKLSVPGNLIAGAIARTSVGFVLNPITVLKARYEVRLGSLGPIM